MRAEKERLIRISRRTDIKGWKKAVIIASAVLVSFLLFGIIANIASPGSFLKFYEFFYYGTLMNPNTIVTLLWYSAFSFGIAVALTPVFKMKFWNIGAEGQCLMGGLGALVVMIFIAPKVPIVIAIILEVLFAVIFATIWTVIPAIFKALFNTNETLFTLMMNYVATNVVLSFTSANSNSPSGGIERLWENEHYGWLPQLPYFNNSYIINIVIIIFVAILLFIYLKYSKHGYELSVVGGSQNTARYVGINVKKVIIRTAILCGVICGLVGFVVVAGNEQALKASSIGGRGFSSIIICWMGEFSIPAMAIYSFLTSFMTLGCENASAMIDGCDNAIAQMSVALFFLILLICTFFINFKIHINLPGKKKEVEGGAL